MSGLTPRLALPYPSGYDPDNVPSWMLQLATKLDNTIVGFTQGTLAARPVGGTVYGKLYYGTDTLVLYQYLPPDANYPAGWRTLGAMPTPPTMRAYNSASQQLYHDAGGHYPDGNVYPFLQVAWDAFAPVGGIWTRSWQRNGWNTSGPSPTVPLPGIYRISGQVRFLHLSTARFQQENYGIWLYKVNDDGSLGSSYGFWQMTDEALSSSTTPPAIEGYPSLRFSAAVPFTLGANDSRFAVYATSSYLPNPGGQGISLLGGDAHTYLESELLTPL